MPPASVSLNSVYQYLTAYDTPSASSPFPASTVIVVDSEAVQVNVDISTLESPTRRDADAQRVLIPEPSMTTIEVQALEPVASASREPKAEQHGDSTGQADTPSQETHQDTSGHARSVTIQLCLGEGFELFSLLMIAVVAVLLWIEPSLEREIGLNFPQIGDVVVGENGERYRYG